MTNFFRSLNFLWSCCCSCSLEELLHIFCEVISLLLIAVVSGVDMLVLQLLAAKLAILNRDLFYLLRFAEGAETSHRCGATEPFGCSTLRVYVGVERLESALGCAWLVEWADFARGDAGQLVPITASYFDLHKASRRCSFCRSWSEAIDQKPVGHAVLRVVLLEWHASSCLLISVVFGESVELGGRGVLLWGRWWENTTSTGHVSTVFGCDAALEVLAVWVDFIDRIDDGLCSCFCGRREDYHRISALILEA